MRLVRVVVFALGALLVALCLALWLALDAAPALTRSSAVSPADVERALNLLKRHDPQRQKPGIVRLLAIEQREVELLVNHLAGRWPGLAANVSLEPGRATVQASVPVPGVARWANVRAQLVQAPGLPEIDRLRIGALPLPSWLAAPMLKRVLEYRGVNADPQLARDVVRHVDLRAGRLMVFYAWQDDTASRMAATLLRPEDEERLKAYSDRLVDLIGAEPVGGVISLARLLPPLFAHARQRSAAGADAALENRAAILTLAFYANRQGLASIVPAARQWRRPAARTVTLGGRSDWPLHYLISAAIAAESGSPMADAVGLYKEISDSQGGSGFSFNDLAADRAGTRFGERAVRQAARLQTQLSAGVAESDLLPDISDLPEFLSAQQFRQRYGAIGSPAYKALMSDIETRLNAIPLLR
jgi:hypothetical protein